MTGLLVFLVGRRLVRHERTLEERCTVGSAEGAGVQIAQRTVSRLHAELEPRDDGLWVRDLDSRNGSFVNDVRVIEARIPPGGTLRLGAVGIAVTYDAEPTPVELWPHDRFGALLGASGPMRALFARLAKVAATDGAVLVQGETGTGKELVAQAIHDASARSAGPFVVVDCAALPEGLLEAELFGHAKGAFTGALGAREGAIASAHGGTVLLDEIGELPLAIQPKLLRIVESKQVRRLGENEHRAVDVRFVCATHRPLRRMVNQGTFREDLYFRLAVLEVELPPLRERLDDVPLLLRHMLGAAAHLAGPDIMRAVTARPWGGNVRELRNFAERLRALGPEEALWLLEGRAPSAGSSHGGAPGSDRRSDGAGAPAAATATSEATAPPAQSAEALTVPLRFDVPYREAREQMLERFERAYFEALLARHQRSVAAAAQAIGVDRTYLYKLIKRYGL